MHGTDKYLVKISVGKENNIHVYIDGDSNVSIDDCVALSRFIESKTDRDIEDYQLSVSSAGVGEPLVHNRQFLKAIDHKIEILSKEGEKFKALLLGVDGNEIMLARELKTKGKKNKTFQTGEKETLSLDDIKYVKEIITFKS